MDAHAAAYPPTGASCPRLPVLNRVSALFAQARPRSIVTGQTTAVPQQNPDSYPSADGPWDAATTTSLSDHQRLPNTCQRQPVAYTRGPNRIVAR